MQTGIIPLTNDHGVSCNVVYFFDDIQGTFELSPSDQFPPEMIQRATRRMGSMIKTYIRLDISEKTSRQFMESCRQDHSCCIDCSVCGLSQGL